MYQFTKTTVINSAKALDYNGNVLVDGNGSDVLMYAGADNVFTVAKAGKFLKSKITGAHKRAYAPGVKEIAKITVPSATAGDILKLTVEVSLSQSTQSEYTNYSLDFKKPQTVEVLYTTDVTTTAGLFVAQLKSLKNRFGHTFFNVSNSGAVITLTAKENEQRFSSVLLYKVEYDTNNTISQMKESVVATGTVTTAGKVGFGDDAYMAKSIVLPTAENVRVFGESKGERPILGGNYSQYTLHYTVEKDHDMGIVSGAVSSTSHVFYVKSDLVTGFENALSAVGIVFGIALSADPTSISLGGGQTTTVVATNSIGAVTFTSGTEAKATVNSTTGVVTPVGVGTTVITAEDSVGNTATITITVEA